MITELNSLEAFGMESRALITELDEIFPAVNPQPTDTMESIMYRSGQRAVVEWIQQKLEMERNNDG